MSEIRYEMFCEAAYGHDDARVQSIIKSLQEQKKFYVIVSPKTSPEAFAKKDFDFFVGPKQILPVFLDLNAANQKAADVNAVIDGNPVTITSTLQALNSMLERYKKMGLVREIRFYERLPFYLDVAISQWLGEQMEKEPEEEKPAAVIPDLVPEPAAVSESMPQNQELVGVKKLIKMLDSQERSAISNYPTYSYFEKFPQLLQKLIQVNHCDPAKMDEELGLPAGVTEITMTDPQANLSKDVLRKFLTYFGLQEYLYRYADNCDELRRELNANPHLFKSKIIPAKVSTKERFCLEDLKRAKDDNGCWLYQLTFKSPTQNYVCVVTSPLGMVVGKEYELEGVSPKVDAAPPSMTDPVPVVGKEEGDAVIQKMKEQFEKDQRSYEETRKDYVIRYFKRGYNPEGRELKLDEAEKYYKKLAKEDDLLDEFFWKHCFPQKVREQLEENPEYQRRRAAQPKDVQSKGYTAKKLQQEFNLTKAWETYFYMVDLRHEPKKTMERLCYRKTDPQYQPQKKQKTDS